MSVIDNTEIINEVLYEWVRLKHSPYKVANALGISASAVLEIIAEHGHRTSEIVERFNGQGRPEMLQYLVAQTRAGIPWDNSDPKIEKARADYEAGTIEMATGRDGRFLLLYAFPRKSAKPRPNYFKPEPSI